MKRAHAEQVEYFEHDGDRYRRFADGVWQVQVSNGWSERFCDSKQLEAIYQQPEKCKSCKYYDGNPYMHCAVHPNGLDGVCGDWEEKLKPKTIVNAFEVPFFVDFELGKLNGQTIRSMIFGDPNAACHEYCMDQEFSNNMNEIWGIQSRCGYTAIIMNGRVERIESQGQTLWQHPDSTEPADSQPPVTFTTPRRRLVAGYEVDEERLQRVELELFRQQCDRIIVRPEHVGIVFCKGLCDGQTLLVDDIIYFDSQQNAAAIERNDQLIWRRRESDRVQIGGETIYRS